MLQDLLMAHRYLHQVNEAQPCQVWTLGDQWLQQEVKSQCLFWKQMAKYASFLIMNHSGWKIRSDIGCEMDPSGPVWIDSKSQQPFLLRLTAVPQCRCPIHPGRRDS